MTHKTTAATSGTSNPALSHGNRPRVETRAAALLMVAAAVSWAGACASDVTVIGRDDLGVRNGGSDGSEDQPNAVSAYEGYGFCSPNLYQGCEGFNATDVPQIAAADEDCLCFRGCNDDSDCPILNEGTATSVCARLDDTFDACVSPCREGETCPTGMTCRDGLLGSGPICTWYTPREKNVRDNPEACSEHTTREGCETAFADTPVAPNFTCAWATVATYARGAAGCEPTLLAERCVRVQLDNPPDDGSACDAAQACGGETQPVYWRDLAGDITLVKVEGCGRPLSDDYRAEFDTCGFGDPSVPTVCDCACND